MQLQMWLGFDVVGLDGRLKKLTDVAELIYTGRSRYSVYRIIVDKEILESTEWSPEMLEMRPRVNQGVLPLKAHILNAMRELTFERYKTRREEKHSCTFKTLLEASANISMIQTLQDRVPLGTYRIFMTMLDPADGFEIGLLSADIRSTSLSPEFDMSRFRKLVLGSKIIRRASTKSPKEPALHRQCLEQIQAFGRSAAKFLGQEPPSSAGASVLPIFHWLTNRTLIYNYPEPPDIQWIKKRTNFVTASPSRYTRVGGAAGTV
ncbi:hypothetical protein FOZ63_006347 [Perkinsus olseni]|uniref:Uncharacterized protein n=1 Tax=Perkinsus olseni TaxID=32597 RepID=A0A7J6UK89_PEROL|nr:hypothetical protein FOZ62_027609 [Perkinsus olseni]KAF4757692.1 hypothetical protein FOZ63_006347 [Perkinsus olseni]